MLHRQISKLKWASIAVASAMLTLSTPVRADVLVEFLFWNEMGKQVGQAIKSHEEYRRERQLWKDNIAAAKQELQACGGCAEAQAKLDKWQGIENKFQDVAGSLAIAGKMPPSVAKWLDIDMPLTPGRTEAQRQESCGIVRRPQAEGTPPQCVAAYDAYLDCLEAQQQINGFCNWKGARNIGGACWDKFKLRNHCAAGNLAGFEKELELQAARADGAIIPEYEAGTHPIVFYGRVPDKFLPNVPPRDVIVSRLSGSGDSFQARINFLMHKQTTGTLTGISFVNFHHRYAAAFTRCFALDRPTDEVGRRICDDLIDLRQYYEDRTLMICDYQGQENSHMPPYLYWFGAQPDGAAPERLLSRSDKHPVLSIAGVRDSCPATRAEADQAEVAWSEYLGSLRAANPQQPASVNMPRPDWIQKQIDEVQARHDAAYARLQEGKQAFNTFPIQGRYRLENPTGTTAQSADCALAASGYEPQYTLSCAFEERTLSADVMYLNGFGEFMIQSDLEDFPTRGSYLVDLAYREAGKGDAIIKYGSFSDAPTLKLVRIGDLTPMLQFPLPGQYKLEIVNANSSITGDCDVVTDTVYQPPRFDFDCDMADGTNIKSEGILRDADGVSLFFGGWYPHQYKLQGKQVDRLYAHVAPGFDPQSPSTEILTGGNHLGVRTTFVRTGSLSSPPAIEPSSAQQNTPNSNANKPAPRPSTVQVPESSISTQRLQLMRGGVSQSGGQRAIVMSVRALENGVSLQVKAGGSDIVSPDGSCLRNKDGSRTILPSAVTLKANKPGQYFGTLDFPLAEAGEWFFQYACAKEFSLVQVTK